MITIDIQAPNYENLSSHKVIDLQAKNSCSGTFQQYPQHLCRLLNWHFLAHYKFWVIQTSDGKCPHLSFLTSQKGTARSNFPLSRSYVLTPPQTRSCTRKSNACIITGADKYIQWRRIPGKFWVGKHAEWFTGSIQGTTHDPLHRLASIRNNLVDFKCNTCKRSPYGVDTRCLMTIHHGCGLAATITSLVGPFAPSRSHFSTIPFNVTA